MTDHPHPRSVLAAAAAFVLLAGSAPAAIAQEGAEPSREAATVPPAPPPPLAGADVQPPYPARVAAPPSPARASAPPVPDAPRQQGFLGVVLDDVEDDDLERLELSEARGALIREVVDGSPADSAGFRADDVVLAWRGESVFSAAELARLVEETPPGREVEARVHRDGDRITLAVSLAERVGLDGVLEGRVPPRVRARVRRQMRHARDHWRGRLEGLEDRLGDLDERLGETWERRECPSCPDAEPSEVHVWFDGRPRLGVRLRSLTPQLAEYFELGDRSGALVSSVRDGSPADSAGLRAGDVLLSVDGEEVSDPGEAARAVRRVSGEVEIRILRRGEPRTLRARLPEREGPEIP